MTTKEMFKEIPLDKLKPNPWNPRDEADFKGADFDELTESIRTDGVYSPIMVRPTKKDHYEIIFGERRYRASCKVAEKNGGIKKATIPAIVREMSDDKAFDACMIENLQRKDLNELQEAKAFKAWVDRHAKKDKKIDVVKDLSDRTHKSSRYINRRIQVMTLPEKVLKAWEKGQIVFGYCEQLVRLGGDEKKINEFFDKAKSWDGYSVTRMRQEIDRESIELQHASFDLEKAGCNTCNSNADIQKKLFGDELGMSKTACLNPKCFKKNQNEGLLKDWEKKYRKKWGTNGVRFFEGYKQPQYSSFGKDDYGCRNKEPADKCLECKDFVTILEISGKLKQKQACLNEKCYTLLKTAKPKNERVDKERIGSSPSRGEGQGEGEFSPAPEAPRVAWHGQHFREEFYQEIMPSWIELLAPDDDKTLRLALTAILNSNNDAEEEFFVRYFGKKRTDADALGGYGRVYNHVSEDKVWEFIVGMTGELLRQAIKELAQYITMQKEKTEHTLRGLIAAHLGIDLARDWRITASYLDKKTKTEILTIGEQLGIFADPKAEAFLKETLGKRKFSALKKPELDRVILESGVDLAGKVPAEILATTPDRSRSSSTIERASGADCLRDENGRCSYIRLRICKLSSKPVCCYDCEDGDDDCAAVCPKLAGDPVCRVCGCSEGAACEGGCSWVEDDLCSACQGKEGADE